MWLLLTWWEVICFSSTILLLSNEYLFMKNWKNVLKLENHMSTQTSSVKLCPSALIWNAPFRLIIRCRNYWINTCWVKAPVDLYNPTQLKWPLGIYSYYEGTLQFNMGSEPWWVHSIYLTFLKCYFLAEEKASAYKNKSPHRDLIRDQTQNLWTWDQYSTLWPPDLWLLKLFIHSRGP